MILYVNGDSNSAGAEIFNPVDSWPNILAKKLDYTLVNKAWSGASNDRILRTTNEFLETDPTDCLIIIGWTSWEREEWQFEGKYYDVNASGYQELPNGLIERYKTWVAQHTAERWQQNSKQQHELIYNLHRDLIKRKIPHLFFNALMTFQHPDQYRWDACYLGPYDNNLSYYWYLKNHGWKHTDNNHYLEDAQPIWAEVLYNYIQEKQLI